MKLVIFRKHLYFSRIFMAGILSFKQLLVIVVAHLFPEFASFWSDFLLNEILNVVCVVEIDIKQVPVVKRSVQHDSEVLARAKRTDLLSKLILVRTLMKMLHIYQLFGKLFLINDLYSLLCDCPYYFSYQN